jgi:hypothetical protein
MTHKFPIRYLISKIEIAKEIGLIQDFTLTNKCEIDSYITIYFHSQTPTETKTRLADHIQKNYDDVINIRYEKDSAIFLVKYDDWDLLPEKVAF